MLLILTWKLVEKDSVLLSSKARRARALRHRLLLAGRDLGRPELGLGDADFLTQLLTFSHHGRPFVRKEVEPEQSSEIGN